MADDIRSGEGALGNVTDIASKAADTARQKISDASEAVQNMSAQDATRMAKQGGEYAYDTITSHPFATAAIGGLIAYALFGSRRSDDYGMDRGYRRARSLANDYADTARGRFGDYAGEARSYADQARSTLSDYDLSAAYDMGRDYAQRLGGQASREPLATAVGIGLVAWMLSSFIRK
ncbi:hypothetical protein GCM10007036_06070 [Alsobacter metallidurans]|uniref:Uncharacterized protein n=1 Tax=Alsobacter metallidurans TaxID=340221 RepID=A0A917MIA6_9HYPH|nr:hypothetical protein [Alsobacter metallidurans]GGH09832.1 hypothetical protein GCM10007036_06070 [Alsobacter metallidurans]